MGLELLLPLLGHEVEDPEEESFVLFSQDLPPSLSLGFLDPKATTLSLGTATGRNLTITQSPSLLNSSLPTGTTGAVLWKVTPLLAEWLSLPENPLFATGCLTPDSTVLELGCGIAGIVAMAVATRTGEYVCTDQDYVLKLLRKNLGDNAPPEASKSAQASKTKPHRKSNVTNSKQLPSNLADETPYPNTTILSLDWETSSTASLPSLLRQPIDNLDVVLACDCIYNTHLVPPFVRTCAELCRLRSKDGGRPILCLVAQQLRTDEVFEEWLKAFMHEFRVWRVPDELLVDGLGTGNGYAVHIGVLKDGDEKMGK